MRAAEFWSMAPNFIEDALETKHFAHPLACANATAFLHDYTPSREVYLTILFARKIDNGGIRAKVWSAASVDWIDAPRGIRSSERGAYYDEKTDLYICPDMQIATGKDPQNPRELEPMDLAVAVPNPRLASTLGVYSLNIQTVYMHRGQWVDPSPD